PEPPASSREAVTTWLGDLRNWWNGPADWEVGFLLAGIIAGLLVSWRLLTYAVMQRVRQQSSGEPEMIFGVIILVFGFIAGISAVPGTNGSMMCNVLAFEGALAEQGVSIPRFQRRVVLERLGKMLDRGKAEKVIIAGDFKHEFSKNLVDEWVEVKQVLRFLKDRVTPILVRGNHDNYL